MTVIAITGHRPENLGPNPEAIWEALGKTLKMFEATLMYQGMAAGVDLASAKVAWKSGIPYICAIPWKGHAPRVCDREEYRKVLAHAYKVVNVVDTVAYPGPWCYGKRNEYMVDHAEQVVAVWNGWRGGGTWDAIDYALATGKPVYAIHPETLEGTVIADKAVRL